MATGTTKHRWSALLLSFHHLLFTFLSYEYCTATKLAVPLQREKIISLLIIIRCTGIRANMKNRLMPMWEKIMLRKRCIIETINDMLKVTGG